MESARVSWVVRLVRGATVGAVSALLTFVSLLTPAPLFALHNNPTALEDGNLCSDCHNMSSNPGAVDAATSYLIANSRALWNIKDAYSGTTPDAIGCVYCHFNNSGTTMKGVTNHWTATSRHPMGETFTGYGARTDTKNEWKSNYLGDTSAASGELDCIDCHAQALVDDPANGDHTTHVPRATRIASGNLYMLTGVSAVGQYDAFCRTCHGNGVATYKGVDIRIRSHKDGSDVTTNALTEADGTVIKTMEGGTVDGVPQLQTGQCTTCHDEHYSNNAVLFNDGKKDAAIVPADCTTICHYAGDYTDNYNRHGHGKTLSTYKVGGIFKDLALACTQCHGNLELGNPGTRKKHAEKTPTGTTQEQYQKRYNLLNKPQTADAGTPSGNPVWGVCQTCHSLTTYKAHYSAEGDPIGCQDCHDEHAEGSGPASNVFMLPEKSRPSGTYSTVTKPRAGTETVFYTTTYLDPLTMLPRGGAYEFYRADGNGVCDNTECHGATNIPGVQPGPLSALMTGGRHTQGDLAAGFNCSQCHEHNSDSGGWRASCTDCHGNTVAGNVWPDSSAEHGTAYPNRLGDHQQHIDAIATAMGWSTVAQKNGSCSWCHPNPGGSGHDTNTVGSLANAADVHGDPQNLTTSFKNILGAANGVATDTYDNTVAANGKDCSNVDCHYRVTTPTAGATADGDGWYQPLAVATCTNCHGDGATGVALPNAHVKHVAASPSGKAYACTQCHPSNASTSHQTGSVNLVFTGAFDPGSSRTETYSVATPAVKFGAAGTYGTCASFYCHGNFTNGTTANAPSWYTLTTGQCGTCHGGDGTGNLTVVATGNHTDHLTAAFGPNMGAGTCTGTLTTGCHTSGALIPAAVATHIDGSVQFDNIAVAPASSTLGTAAVTVPTATETDRCSYCHGSATVNATVGAALAKVNWATDAYVQPCLTCHVAANGGKQFADGTGMAAPDELGDDVNYGAEVRGHNRPTAAGSYTDASAVATNPAANKTCTDCHSATAAHINGANDTTYAGQRLLATINGVATLSSFNTACYACHATGGTTPATSLVSTHGNINASFVPPAKDAAAENFAYNCNACHNVHGMTNGTGYNNIYMIKTTIGVGNSFTTTPGGADATTIANIRFERVSGLDSMDDGATPIDNICYTCHTNANRPGSGTAMRTAGGDHTGNAGGYTSNDTTKNCASCHVHNYDAVQIATTDGFAPQQCNACHSYPGLSTVGSEKVLSGVHNMHVDTTTGYAYPCAACHYLYTHNQSNFVDGGVWNDTNVPIANINVRFDPARNAGVNLTYAGGDADVGTGASATHNGVCANLYCHGDNTTSQTDWVGAGAPAWATADPARLSCIACHADVPATGVHALHVTNNGATDRSDCNLCHTNTNGIDAVSPIVTTHANNTTDVLNGYTGAAAPLGVDGYCSTNTCHSSAAADGRWNDPVLNCDACHYFNTAGNPSAVTNTAGTTFRIITETSHDGHFAAAGMTWTCNICHPDNSGDTTGAASLTVGLTHVTPGAGTDATILQPKAVPVQDNALISTTAVAQWWNAPADWVDAANTCANKCHNPSAAAKLSTAWGTANTGCEFCHNTATAPATGSHVTHIGASTLFGITVTCVSCHQNNAGNDGHMSGTVNLANMTGLIYGGTVAIPYGAPFGTCTTTSCHNNGLNVAAASPTWGVGSADCTICHAATPATPANGAHTDHMAVAGYACGDCHAAATAATHIDGSVTIKAGLTYSGTVVVGDAGYGSCSTGSCHNAAANIAWNVAATTCDECHSAAADVNDFVGNNKAASMINTAEYTAASTGGHGKASGPAISKSCSASSCHVVSGTTHDFTATLTGANPYRLVDQDGGTAGLQFSCSYTTGCHPAATATPRNGLTYGSIVTHSNEAMAAASYATKRTWPAWNPRCTECHDPHGDGANLSMIQGNIYDKGSSVAGVNTGSENWGVHATPDTQAIVFTDNTTGLDTTVPYTSYADNGAGVRSSLCQECHEAADIVAYKDNTSDNIVPHSSASDCSGCHKHDSAFKPSGCSGCHGDGVSSNAPDNPAGAYEDRAGAHAAHIAAIGAAVPAAAGNNSCTYCHPGNPPAGHSTDVSTGASQAEIIRMSTDGAYVGPPTAGDFWIRDVSSVATAGGNLVYFKTLAGANDTDAFYNSTAKTCANINCHGSQTTPAWYPDVTAPAWTPSYSITATGGIGFATLSWNAAVDAETPPVTYDIYASTTNTAVAVFTGPPIQTDVTGTSAVVSRGAGTWYFGVRAKDSKTPTNSTSGEGISAGAIVTAPAGACSPGTSTSYYGGLIGALPVISDGTYNPTATGGTFTTNATTFGRQPMSTTINATNQTYVGTMPTTGVFNRLGRFYLPALASSTCVGPNVTAGAIGVTSTANTDSFQVNLVDYDPAGAVGNGTILGSSTALAGTTVRTERTFTMTFAQTQVAAGHMLVMEVMGRPATANNRLTVNFGGDATAGRRTRLATPIFVPTPEAVPPVWAGGISNIAVTNPNSDGRLSVTWNTATDATSPPVSFNLYRSSVSAADVWNNLVYSGLAATGKVDSGLTNGTTYWYGVRAVDRIGNQTSNDAQTASGIPSAPGSGCTLCHGIPPAAAGNAGSHAAHANSDADYTDCNKCHPGTTGYTTAHSDGVGQLAFDGTAANGVYGAGLTYTDGAVIYNDADGYGTLTGTAGDGIDDGTCSGTGTSCHSAATPQWGNAATVVCGSCHGTAARGGYNDPSTDDDGAPPDDTLSAVTGTRVGKHLIHLNVSYGHTGSSCGLCHLNAGSGTAAHADGTASGGGRTADVAFNTTYAGGTATFTTGAPPTCTNLSTANCHSGSANWDTAAPAMLCTQCHTIGAGKHMAITKGGADQTCTACHPGGTSYPTRHSKNANANVIEIPTNTVVGITASPGIHLGGDHTATKAIGSWGVRPTTEAEMCWFCHDQSGNAVLEPATEASEWSSNFGSTYNEGSISTARWIGATWTSAQTASPSFAYKSAVINPDTVANSRRGSIHTAMTVAQGGPADNYGDTTAQIRCSYCHDVHDFNKATGDTTSGRPWLRGQWKASPYKQDGAPQSGTAYPNVTPFGAVPRARTINTHSMGGYWIDQNSNSPASAWTPAVFGGLCALCHDGTPGDDQDWTSAEIGNINVFGTMSDWVSGNNGHANSVKGGAGGGGVTARNIYNARGGTSAYATNGFAHFQGMTEPGNNGNYGFREAASFYVYTPSTNSNEGNPTGTDQWGVDETGATLQNNYHQFPCSKCHVPHASRLPRLMKTNCLDTKQNTWDNTYQLSAATGNNLNRSISNWTTAQNCHRRGGEDPADVGDSAGTGAGWNNVTPW